MRCAQVKIFGVPSDGLKAIIGNSLWVYLLLWRYLLGVPVHRILQNLSLPKLSLLAGTVAGGFQKIEPLLDSLCVDITGGQSGEIG